MLEQCSPISFVCVCVGVLLVFVFARCDFCACVGVLSFASPPKVDSIPNLGGGRSPKHSRKEPLPSKSRTPEPPLCCRSLLSALGPQTPPENTAMDLSTSVETQTAGIPDEGHRKPTRWRNVQSPAAASGSFFPEA